MGGGRAGGGLVRRALQVRRARVRAPLVGEGGGLGGVADPWYVGFKEDTHATPMDRCGMVMGVGGWTVEGVVSSVLHTLHTLHTFFREKGRERV